MDRKEIEVTFKTLTPLWTGDAWQNNSEIRPSSLIGSLRFWFEVICYFGSVLEKKDFNSQNGRFEKEVDRDKLKNFIQEKGRDINEIVKYLIEKQNIPISSVIFGTTNWRSLIEINEIFNVNKDDRYQYYLGKMEFPELKHNGKIPSWFFKKGFYGDFKVKFLVEETLKDTIFYPLLTFMDKYGFWGGKWNIGYGRIKVEKVEESENGNWEKNDNWRKENFKVEGKIKNFIDFIDINVALNMDSKSFEFLKYFLGSNTFYCNNERELKNKISSIPKKIKVVKFNNSNENYVGLIKKLLKKKVEMRDCLRPVDNVYDKKLWNNFRHKLLGTTSGEIEGTKIIPWIYEEDRQLKGGFVSIAGILNLGG